MAEDLGPTYLSDIYGEQSQEKLFKEQLNEIAEATQAIRDQDYVCQVMMSDGKICGKTFESQKKLNAHRGPAHTPRKKRGPRVKKQPTVKVTVKKVERSAPTFKYLWNNSSQVLLEDNNGDLWSARKVKL